MEHLVKGLHLDSTELKMHCAAAIFKVYTLYTIHLYTTNYIHVCMILE